MLSSYIGGSEVTSIVQEATSEHWLNKKYVATVKIPVAQASPDLIGQRLALVDPDLPGNALDFNGVIKITSAEEGGEYDGMVEYTAESAREIWEWRPARDGPSDPDGPGNYIAPDFLARLKKAPLVMQDVLLQSADGSDPAVGEGSMFMEFGSFPSDGLDLSGAPLTYPVSIEALASQFAATGEFDAVETMIDSGGNTSRIDCYNGHYPGVGGGSYAYEPDGNIRAISWTRDMSKMVNKLRYLLGPRKTPTRWQRSVDGTDPDFPDTSTYSHASLRALIFASRGAYGVRSEIRTYDSFGNEANAAPFYWRLWQDESLWRCQPRLIVKWTATEGIYPTFDIGANLSVSWHPSFMGGGSGTQRAFGRKVRWDVDGVAYLDEIATSPDGDSL